MNWGKKGDFIYFFPAQILSKNLEVEVDSHGTKPHWVCF